MIEDRMHETETHTPEFHDIEGHTESFLPLLPLKNVVILPKSIIPIIVGRPTSIKAVEYALKHDKMVFITAQKDPKTEVPGLEDVFHYGTQSIILQVMRMPNGALKILAEGLQRAKVISAEQHEGFLGVHCQIVPTTNNERTIELEAIWRQLQSLYHAYTQHNEKAPTELTAMVKTVQDMDHITDTIAVHITNLSFEERQSLLEMTDLQERMLRVCSFLKKEIDIIQTEQLPDHHGYRVTFYQSHRAK